jgi:hypothetical protein
MFERMIARAERAAAARARLAIRSLAERLRSETPQGMKITEEPGGIRLSGRALRRRLALDPVLRWLIARLK